jgi:hypothetical protein
MQDLFKTMLTPTWIVSTVVVGLILNVLSGYVKGGVDKLLMASSKRAEQASTRRAAARKALIIRLGTNPALNREYRIARFREGFIGAVGAVGGIVILMASLVNAGHHDTPGAHISGTTILEVVIVTVGLLILALAHAFGLACANKSIVLIESEAYSTDTVEQPSGRDGLSPALDAESGS